MNSRQQFKKLMEAPGIVPTPGVGHAGHAKLVEEAGFPAVYMSGSFVSFTYGWPDAGLLTLDEMVAQARQIVDRVNIPLIADADEGYGGIVNLQRAIRDFEHAGVAAIHLEDMSTKKHGAMMPISVAANRIKAAVEARSDPNFHIIGRTDAVAPWRSDMDPAKREDDCMKRSLAYVEAGADIIMIQVGPTSSDSLRRFCQEIPKPILVTMGSWNLNPPWEELEQLGVKVAIYPVLLRNRLIPVMRSVLKKLKEEKRAVFTAEERKEWDYVNKTVLGLDELRKSQAKYGD